MSLWILHHIIAQCQDCEWSAQRHGDHPWADVLDAARHHAISNEHYVQVERGQHAHYDERVEIHG